MEGTGTWGRTSATGYGWRLQAGALLPLYTDGWTVHHYKYIDASGTDYRLEVNNGGVWTSKEAGVYVSYDSNQKRLYFPDGSFWAMGSESAGTEPDAGTLYPTVMQDTNGNQVTVRYLPGLNGGDFQFERTHRVHGGC